MQDRCVPPRRQIDGDRLGLRSVLERFGSGAAKDLPLALIADSVQTHHNLSGRHVGRRTSQIFRATLASRSVWRPIGLHSLALPPAGSILQWAAGDPESFGRGRRTGACGSVHERGPGPIDRLNKSPDGALAQLVVLDGRMCPSRVMVDISNQRAVLIGPHRSRQLFKKDS
jgi:hypothetical protein